MTSALLVWLAVPVFTWDLAAGDGGLVAEGDTLQWSWSPAPAAGPGPDDPAWATVPDGTYLNDSDDQLRIDLPDLSATTTPHLIVEQWVVVRGQDRSVIEIDTGGGWVEVEPVGGYPSIDGFSGDDALTARWERIVVPLAPVALSRARLRLVSNLVLSDDGWYVRALEVVDGDVVAPVVTPVLEPADTQDVAGPYLVEVDAVDDVGVVDVQLRFRHDGVEQPAVAMTQTSPGRFVGELPAPAPGPRAEVSWWVEASDGEQIGRYPATGDATFDVFLAAPTDLSVDADPRYVGQDVPLVWTAPEGPNPLLDYVVRPVLDLPGCDEAGQDEMLVPDASVRWPLVEGAGLCVEVAARYDVAGGPIVGESSDVLFLDVEVPGLTAVRPDRGYAGTTQWVELEGTSLYLDPATPPSFGPDAEVRGWEVLDAHRGRLQVTLVDGAAVGPADVTIRGLHGEATFEAAFTIDDAADAPRILSVRPDTVTQGDDVELVVEASEAFGGEVVVEGGSDVFATGPATVDGGQLVVPMSVSTRARLGERTLLVDDGVRLWTVPLTVEEYRVPIRKRCQTGSAAGAGLLGWCVAWVGLLGRRRSRRAPRG